MQVRKSAENVGAEKFDSSTTIPERRVAAKATNHDRLELEPVLEVAPWSA